MFGTRADVAVSVTRHKKSRNKPKLDKRSDEYTKYSLLNDLNLRSGAVTQDLKATYWTKKTHAPNESEREMDSLEQSLKTMLMDFKEGISQQIGELRSEFEQIRNDVKEIRSDLGEALSNRRRTENPSAGRERGDYECGLIYCCKNKKS